MVVTCIPMRTKKWKNTVDVDVGVGVGVGVGWLVVDSFMLD